MRLRELLMISVAVVSVLCLVTVLVLSLVEWRDSPESDYGIVFDCGSSHTSLNLFTWAHRNDPTLPLIFPAKVDPTLITETKLPISSFLANPSQAGASLQPLLDAALTVIPPARVASTVVRLGATAGMRDAMIQNATAAEMIMDSVRSFISTYPFTFQPEWAQIINGSQEGTFGWLTVNYLLGTLNDGTNNTGMALDMGGASTQITFVPTTPPLADDVSLCVYSACYTIYTHSYLGYGLGQFAIALNNAVGAGAVGNVSQPCVPVGQTLANPTNPSLFLLGSSDPLGCSNLVTSQLNLSQCLQPTCGVGGVYQPPVPHNMSINAFSGYYFPIFAMSNSVMFNLSLSPSIAELAAAQQVLCAMNANQIMATFPDKFSYTSQYCQSVSYFVQLFTLGYNLSLDTRVQFATTIQGEDVGWALGGMIMFENLLPVTPSMYDGCGNGCSILNGPGSIAAISVFAVLSAVSVAVFIAMMVHRRASNPLESSNSLVENTRSL